MSLLYLHCRSLLSGSQLMSLVETRLSFIFESFSVREMLNTLCFFRKRFAGLPSGLLRQNYTKLSQRLCFRASMYTTTFGALFSAPSPAGPSCSCAERRAKSESRKAQ